MNSIDILLLEYTLGVIILMLIPLAPVIYAVWDRKGYEPLPVNMKYTKDPRAIAKYFDQYFYNSFGDKVLKPGEILNSKKLGKLEVVEETFHRSLYKDMVYIVGKAKVPDRSRFEREVISRDELEFGNRCYARVIKSQKKLILGEENCIVRWIDSESTITVGRYSHINIASSMSTMHLEKGVSFRRLYGYPVLTSHAFSFRKNLEGIREEHIDKPSIDENLLYVPDKKYTLTKGTILFRSLVTQGHLIIEQNTKVFGNIKSNGDVEVGDNSFIDGNIIAEGSIKIGKNCFVVGNLFSRASIKIDSYTQIGTSEHPKSVISKKMITLAEHVAIFNYLLTDKTGEVK